MYILYTRIYIYVQYIYIYIYLSGKYPAVTSVLITGTYRYHYIFKLVTYRYWVLYEKKDLINRTKKYGDDSDALQESKN